MDSTHGTLPLSPWHETWPLVHLFWLFSKPLPGNARKNPVKKKRLSGNNWLNLFRSVLLVDFLGGEFPFEGPKVWPKCHKLNSGHFWREISLTFRNPPSFWKKHIKSRKNRTYTTKTSCPSSGWVVSALGFRNHTRRTPDRPLSCSVDVFPVELLMEIRLTLRLVAYPMIYPSIYIYIYFLFTVYIYIYVYL